MATQQVNERLAALTAAGTSVWLDQIGRQLIESGELAAAARGGLAARRDLQPDDLQPGDPRRRRLRRPARRARPRRAPTRAPIYQELAIQDIQAACDVLRPVYDATAATTATSRFEVDPDLAFDTERTMEQAREYWERVDRPNLMIKIPGTDEGVPGDRGDDLRGAQHQRHAAVLRRRLRARGRGVHPRPRAPPRRGQGVDVHSVASFFVSRVDTEVDKRLEGLGRTDLQGRAGAGQRARRLPALRGRSSTASASPPCSRPARRCSARCGRRPASRTRRTPTRCTSTGSSGPRRSTRCRWRRCWPPPTTPRSTATPSDDRPRARPARRWPRPASTSTTSPTSCCSDGVDKFVEPMEKLLAGLDAKREAIVTHAPAVDRGVAPRRPRAAHRRAQSRARRPRPTSRTASGRRTRRCGARRRPPSSATASAG